MTQEKENKRIFNMSLGPDCGKPLCDRVALWLVVITSLVLFIIALYTASIDTHARCLETCEEAYKLNIDNSWHVCEDRCDEKFGK